MNLGRLTQSTICRIRDNRLARQVGQHAPENAVLAQETMKKGGADVGGNQQHDQYGTTCMPDEDLVGERLVDTGERRQADQSE